MGIATPLTPLDPIHARHPLLARPWISVRRGLAWTRPDDLRFGAGNLRGAFWTVDTLLGAGGLSPAYDGYLHFDFKPPRAEGLDGVWESARGCMRNYLILRERALAFRADPEVQAAVEAAGVGELSTPTLEAGESLAAVREADYDIDALAARSVGLEALDQLAMDHLLGAR